MQNPSCGSDPGLSAAKLIMAGDILMEGQRLCDLIHMAARTLSEHDRDAVHVGVDAVRDRLSQVVVLLREVRA